MTAVEKAATQEKITHIQLETASDNIEAQSLYTKQGWGKSPYITFNAKLNPRTT